MNQVNRFTHSLFFTDQKDTKFNLEEWVKRRYSEPLKKTILGN